MTKRGRCRDRLARVRYRRVGGVGSIAKSGLSAPWNANLIHVAALSLCFPGCLSPKPKNGSGRDPLETHVLAEKIEQRTHARRQRTALAHIDGVEFLEIAGIGVFEHRHQSAGIDIVAHGEGGKTRKAGA